MLEADTGQDDDHKGNRETCGRKMCGHDPLLRCECIGAHRPVLFQDRFLRQLNGFTDQKFWLRRGMLAAIARGLPSAKGSPWGRGASLDATYSRWPRAAGGPALLKVFFSQYVV